MKIVRFAFIGLLVLISVVFVVASILPGDKHLEQSVVIKASPQVVFNQINNLKNWEKWSPWQTTDEGFEVEYESITEGKTASFNWLQGNGLRGKLTIEEATPYSSLTTKHNYYEQGYAKSQWTLTPSGDSVTLTWVLDTRLGFPLQRLTGIKFDQVMQPFMQKGLSDLKKIAEQQTDTLQTTK